MACFFDSQCSILERQNDEARLDAFKMKRLRKIPQVSWTTKKLMSDFLTKLKYKGNC